MKQMIWWRQELGKTMTEAVVAPESAACCGEADYNRRQPGGKYSSPMDKV
jgi:hypothetical protein